MTAISHHVHVHIAGLAAGIDLFGRSAAGMLDPAVGDLVRDLRAELFEERRQLRRMANGLGVGESSLLTGAARVGERIGRLKPNESLLRRTPLTDLVELEAMRLVVATKRAGWEALQAVAGRHEALDAEELRGLVEQTNEQERLLAEAHVRTASHVLAPH